MENTFKDPMLAKSYLVDNITSDLNMLVLEMDEGEQPSEARKLMEIDEKIKSFYSGKYYNGDIKNLLYSEFKTSNLPKIILNLREKIENNRLESRLWMPVIKNYFSMVRVFLIEMKELEQKKIQENQSDNINESQKL